MQSAVRCLFIRIRFGLPSLKETGCGKDGSCAFIHRWLAVGC